MKWIKHSKQTRYKYTLDTRKSHLTFKIHFGSVYPIQEVDGIIGVNMSLKFYSDPYFGCQDRFNEFNEVVNIMYDLARRNNII